MTTPTVSITPTSTNTAPADSQVMPYFAPRSTQARLRHFTTGVYNVGPDTYLYKLTDALCGDSGAGSLKKELLVSRMQSNLNSTYFTDLDNTFGNFAGLVRFASETYTYDPANQMLTSDQWNEVRCKDAAYRARIKSFMLALSQGGNDQGFILMCRAATGYDSHLSETWKNIDEVNEGRSPFAIFGRLGTSIRNEVVIQPLASTITTQQTYTLNKLLERIKPRETVITISTSGLAVHTQVTINAVAASDSYFQIEKTVTGVPDLANIPAAPVLAADIDPANQWLKPNVPIQAPYTAFNNSQENSVYYLYSLTGTTVIDTVTYTTQDINGNISTSQTFNQATPSDGFGPWNSYDLADSPDNFPGGKYGQTPYAAPALTSTGQPYTFPYASQAAYVTQQQTIIQAIGGQATATQYRLPLARQTTTGLQSFDPINAIPLQVPVKESTVTTPWIRRPTISTQQFTQQINTSAFAGA